MSFSNYLELKILDHTFKGTAFTQPTNLYVSLHSADPGETGASEIVGTGYARMVQNNWNTAAAGAITTSAATTFASATGAWSQITHFGIWDSVTAGNFFGGGAVSTAKTLASADIAEFAAAAITVTLD